jgi:polar amino acid transport system permease protein
VSNADDTLRPDADRAPGSWLYDLKPTRGDIILIACLAAVLAWMGLGGTRVGGLLAPLLGGATGPDAEPGLILNVLTGILIAVAVWVNVAVVRFLPFGAQIWIVWIELLLLFVAFVGSFNRDLGVWFEESETGQTNIAFLITTGAVTTLYVSLISIVIACCIAMAAALARLSKSGPAYAVSTFYTSFFRGTPLLLQVYLIYLGLPTLGRQFALDAVPSGIIALSLCYGAYMAEIFRAGILGVPHGQRDAAMALGLPPGLTFRKIIFPQAMRLIVPPTGNQFIAMLKDSSLVSVMGVWELTKTAQIIGKRDFRVFEMLIAAAIIYWAMSICFELIQSRIERHYGKGYVR